MTKVDRKAMQERKREFVEGALCECLKEVDPDIDDVNYAVIEGEEIVTVTYIQGGGRPVFVTACGPAEIVKAVIKVLE